MDKFATDLQESTESLDPVHHHYGPLCGVTTNRRGNGGMLLTNFEWVLTADPSRILLAPSISLSSLEPAHSPGPVIFPFYHCTFSAGVQTSVLQSFLVVS